MDEVVNQCSHSATSNHRRKLVTRENADGNGAEQSVTLKLSEDEEGLILHSRKLSWPSFPFILLSLSILRL